MLYFTLKVEDIVDNGKLSIAVGGGLHCQAHKITHLLHKGNEFGKLFEKDSQKLTKKEAQLKNDIFDFSASLIAAYFAEGNLKSFYFFANNINCCRDNILNLGFHESCHDDTLSILRGYDKITYLLFGYQHERGLERRVHSLLDLAQNIREPQYVILTGKNSGSKNNIERIPNECLRMRNMLDEYLKNNPHYNMTLIFQKEEASTDTKENIGNCLHGDFLSNKENHSQVLVLVSSTFHLIRIGEAILEVFREDMKEHNNTNLLAKIDRIVLIGAEDQSIELKKGDQEYIKNMSYDVLRNNIF